MSKDVVIAAVIVAACLGLVTVAFIVPRHNSSSNPESKITAEPATPDYSPISPTQPQNDPFVDNNPFPQDNPNVAPVIPTPGPEYQPIPERPTNYPPIEVPPTQPEVTTVTTVTPPSTEERTHTVASGETLGEISQKYYNSARHWKKIAEVNKVDPSDLKVGQKLIIPVLENNPSAVVNNEPTLSGGERSYTVKKGDSYYSIAKNELGNAARWKEIEKLNGIPAEELQPGKNIKLPASETAAGTNSNPGLIENSSNGGRIHVVAAGETLSDISKKYYGTSTKWKEIVKANPGVDPEGLKVGQKLNISEIAGTTPSPTTSSNSGSGSLNGGDSFGTYTVQAGDTTLAMIAQKELGSSKEWPKIVEANPGLDPRKLRIGQKLIIPGKSNSQPSTNAGNTFTQPTDNLSNGNNNVSQPVNNLGPSYPLPNDPTGTAPAYPTPPTETPPTNNALPPISTLPESLGGNNGFNNSP